MPNTTTIKVLLSKTNEYLHAVILNRLNNIFELGASDRDKLNIQQFKRELARAFLTVEDPMIVSILEYHGSVLTSDSLSVSVFIRDTEHNQITTIERLTELEKGFGKNPIFRDVQSHRLPMSPMSFRFDSLEERKDTHTREIRVLATSGTDSMLDKTVTTTSPGLARLIVSGQVYSRLAS